MPGDEPVGPDEPRDQGLLSSAAARPFQSAFGEEPYKTIFEKAAVLFHSLIANHPFHNGNKRTAVLALDHFLLANGWCLILDDRSEMYSLAKETASYRERGVSHDDILKHIIQVLEQKTLSFRRLKKIHGTTKPYRAILGFRRWVRNHPHNREQPGEE